MLSSTLIYTTMFIVTSILAELTAKHRNTTLEDKIGKVIFIAFTLCIPSILSAIRYGIGTDYFNYVRIFENVNSGISTRSEPGYVLLNFIVGSLGGNIHHLFFIVSFMTILFVYLFLNTYKEEFSIGLGIFIYLILYYNISLNIVRQSLAVVIVLYAFKFIEKRKALKFYLFIGIAMLFHVSAIVILPFYYIYNNLANKSILLKLFIYIVIFIAIVNYQTFIEFIGINILRNPYYLHYAQSEAVDMGIGLFIIYAPTVMLGAIFYNKLNSINSNFKFYYFLLIIGFILRLLPYFGASSLERIADYFLVSQVWLVPFYYRTFNVKNYSVLFSNFLIIFYMIHWFYLVIVLGGAGTVPYTTILM